MKTRAKEVEQDSMTIIITFPEGSQRSRILAWLQRALALCPIEVLDVSVSAPGPNETGRMH